MCCYLRSWRWCYHNGVLDSIAVYVLWNVTMAFSLNYCFRFKTNVKADKNKSVYYQVGVYLERARERVFGFAKSLQISCRLFSPFQQLIEIHWRSSDCVEKIYQPNLVAVDGLSGWVGWLYFRVVYMCVCVAGKFE